MSTERIQFAFDDRRRPVRLLMLGEDGTEHQWRYDSTVNTRSELDYQDCETAYLGQCEWLVRSMYRESRCGRSGYDDGYGMTLCWQHQDKLMSHLLHRLQNKQWPPRQLEDFAKALAQAPYHSGPFSTANPLQILLRVELQARLEEVVYDDQIVTEDVMMLIDKLIDRRLSERMGLSSGEGDSSD